MSVCVLCGTPWEPSHKNRCEVCGGFCTWGEAKDAKATSWADYERGIPEPVPPGVLEEANRRATERMEEQNDARGPGEE